MINLRWTQLIMVFVMGAIMTGCGRGILNTEPFVDAKKDEQGHVILLDTPRMWNDWREEVERAVASEVGGARPGGGIPSWNSQWLRIINANSDRENSSKYISYIIESRRQAGLPELEGYLPAGDE